MAVSLKQGIQIHKAESHLRPDLRRASHHGTQAAPVRAPLTIQLQRV